MADALAAQPVPAPDAPVPGGVRRRTHPGTAVQLTEHLWQVAGAGITHPWDAAAYLIWDGEPVLVDCGSPLGIESLSKALTAVGLDIADIGAVIGTHGHYDHLGGAAAFSPGGTSIHLHPADAAAVATGDPVRTCAGPLYGELFPPVASRPLHDGQRITAGRAELDILHTPGHTPGSVCVAVTVDRRRILIAGDTLYGGFSPEIGSDAGAWRASLERLEAERFDFLTFGHGVGRLLADTAARIAEARLRFGSYYDPWFRPPRYRFIY